MIWQLAVIFDAWRLTKEIPDSKKYDCYILDYYVRALASEDEWIRTSAADSLFAFYSRMEQYETAEEYLAYYSQQNPEKKRKQAVIYSKTNRLNEAYKAYEELLFSGYQMINMVLNSLYILVVQEEEIDKAHMLVEKQKKLATLFDMGEYYEASCELDLVTFEKDVDATIEIMERMIASLDYLGEFRNSSLYEHMVFKEISGDFLKELKKNLLTCFRDEETYGYMKKSKRWQDLLNRITL